MREAQLRSSEAPLGSGIARAAARARSHSSGSSSGVWSLKPSIPAAVGIGCSDSPHSGQTTSWAVAAGVKRSRQPAQQRLFMTGPLRANAGHRHYSPRHPWTAPYEPLRESVRAAERSERTGERTILHRQRRSISTSTVPAPRIGPHRPTEATCGVSTDPARSRALPEPAAPSPPRREGARRPPRESAVTRACATSWSAAVRRPWPCRGRNARVRTEPLPAERPDHRLTCSSPLDDHPSP